jgi:hypothetical protein
VAKQARAAASMEEV